MAGGAGRRLGRRKRDGSGYPDGRKSNRSDLPDPFAPRPSAVGHHSAATVREGQRCWRRKAWGIVDVSHYLVTFHHRLVVRGGSVLGTPSHPASFPPHASGRPQTIQPLGRSVPEQTNPTAQDSAPAQGSRCVSTVTGSIWCGVDGAENTASGVCRCLAHRRYG